MRACILAILAIVTAASLAFGSAASAQQQDVVATTIEVPVVKVGDTCVYARRDQFKELTPYAQVVVSLNVKGYVAEFRDRDATGPKTETAHYTREGNVFLNDGPAGKIVNAPFVPRFQFPLAVGKTWNNVSYSYELANGQKGTWEVSGKVEAIEELKVPAGTFRAAKVQLTGSLKSGSGGVMTETIWYSPDTGCVLKHMRNYPQFKTSRELTSFQRG